MIRAAARPAAAGKAASGRRRSAAAGGAKGAAAIRAGPGCTAAAAGLTQYLTQDAIQQTMRDVAGLAPATTYVATFIVPPEAAHPADRELIALTARINKARGTPWLSTFTPDQFAHLAQESGLHNPTPSCRPR